MVVRGRLNDCGRLAVHRWTLLARRHCRMYQLQRRLRVPGRLQLVNAAVSRVCCRHLRVVRCDDMQCVQCGVRLSCRLRHIDAAVGAVPRWYLQCSWSDVVHQLQRWIRVYRWIDVSRAICGVVSCRHVQCVGCSGVHEL
jgi:hypothetical protein